VLTNGVRSTFRMEELNTGVNWKWAGPLMRGRLSPIDGGQNAAVTLRAQQALVGRHLARRWSALIPLFGSAELGGRQCQLAGAATRGAIELAEKFARQ